MDTGEKTYDLNQLPDYQKKVVEPLSEDVQQDQNRVFGGAEHHTLKGECGVQESFI